MTSVDHLPLFIEVFGPQLKDTNRFGDGSFLGTDDGRWFEWRDGELIRCGSIEKLHAIHNEVKANGGGDLREILWEWDWRGTARIKDEAAAIIREILLE